MYVCIYVSLCVYAEAAEPGGGGTGGTCPPPPPHFSPQSMKCPTSTGVHARPTMYQEGVPRGAIQNRKTWGIAPRAINPGGTIKLLHYRKECPEGQYKIEKPGEMPPGQ